MSNPAPFIPAPGVVRTHIRATLHNEQIENVLNWLAPAGGSASVNAVADLVYAAWAGRMLAVLSSSYSFREVYATDQTSQTGPVYTRAAPAPLPGLIGNPGMPGNVCAVITHRTADRGRTARGRTYLSGLSETQCEGNGLTVPAQENIIDAWGLFVSDVETQADCQLVIVSYQFNKQPRSTALARPVIASLLRDAGLDSQRRRLAGRGR